MRANEQYAEAALLQKQLQALERTAVRSAFEKAGDAPAPAPAPAPARPSAGSSTALVREDENVLSQTRGPMQRRPSQALAKTPAQVLTDRERARLDGQPDALFYKEARLVTHVDLKFALRLQELYGKRLLPGSAVLDLGAACVSYMPEGVALREVVGLGMNMEEMEANDDLTERVVHDLNARAKLPFDDDSFDAVVCASAIQYYTQPEAVLAGMYVCIYIWTCMHACMYIYGYACMHACIYMDMHVCMYIIYIYVCNNIYIYIYIYIL